MVASLEVNSHRRVWVVLQIHRQHFLDRGFVYSSGRGEVILIYEEILIYEVILVYEVILINAVAFANEVILINVYLLVRHHNNPVCSSREQHRRSEPGNP